MEPVWPKKLPESPSDLAYEGTQETVGCGLAVIELDTAADAEAKRIGRPRERLKYP